MTTYPQSTQQSRDQEIKDEDPNNFIQISKQNYANRIII
jgi:hypothetical protein